MGISLPLPEVRVVLERLPEHVIQSYTCPGKLLLPKVKNAWLNFLVPKHLSDSKKFVKISYIDTLL